jgi:hypothetical protein
VAFAIPAAAEAGWRQRLEERGIVVESTVDWPRGGRIMYFREFGPAFVGSDHAGVLVDLLRLHQRGDIDHFSHVNTSLS